MPTKKPTEAAAAPTPPADHSQKPHTQRLTAAALAYHQGVAHDDEEYTRKVQALDEEQRLAAFFNGWDALQNARATRMALVEDAQVFVRAQLAAERAGKAQ